MKNNGINDNHDKEILDIFCNTKITRIDLSCNEMEKLGGLIGRKLRDECTHIAWIDLTQNFFINDVLANASIIAGLKRQKELFYAGVSS